MIKKILKKILLEKRCIVCDLKSNVDFKMNNMRQNKLFPTIIKNSKVSGISVNEGCEIVDCFCYGNVQLGRFVSIMGPGTGISSVLGKISIGSFSSIGQNVNIQDSYHRYDKITTYFTSRNIFKNSVELDVYSKGDVIIEEDVWIGSNSNILSGVKIGRGSIIGAGSVVTKDIPRYSIAYGSPAKVYKKRFSDEVIEFLEMKRWWEWDLKTIQENEILFKLNLNEIDLNEY